MKQEEKDLLLKDLCARLPYGVICKDGYGNVLELNSIDRPNTVTFKCSDNTFWTTDLDKCKPYLFPLSSMTEEQSLELEIITGETIGFDAYSLHDFTGYSEISLSKTLEIIQWCYGNHFDINGLIPMGLANDATGLNIY